MASLFFLFLAIIGLMGFATCTPAPISRRDSNQGIFVNNQAVLVNLRIEGALDTIFEGFVFSSGHNVTTQSGGTHHCDGTNSPTNSTPGATATSALDDASHSAHFTWDGTFNTQFDDFFITRIADSAQTPSQFWRLLVNFQSPKVGGCHLKVQSTDRVLWAFDGFSKLHFLQITAPQYGLRDRPITITVTDGFSGLPIAGASVEGQLTDSQGHANLMFTNVGLKRLKATKSDSIRSNTQEVLITS